MVRKNSYSEYSEDIGELLEMEVQLYELLFYWRHIEGLYSIFV